MPRPGWSSEVCVNAMSFCLLVRLMQDKAHTYAELTEATGLFSRTVRKWVAEMKRQELVFIQDWHMVRAKTGTPAPNWAPMWRWKVTGAEVDAPKPKTGKTKEEYQRDYRLRKKRLKELEKEAFTRSLEQLCVTTP